MIIIQLTDMPSEMTSSLSVLHNQLNTNESNKLSTLVLSEDTHHYACLMGTKLLIKFVVHTKFLSIKTIKYQLSTFTTLAVHAHVHPTKIKQVSNSLQKTSVNSYTDFAPSATTCWIGRNIRVFFDSGPLTVLYEKNTVFHKTEMYNVLHYYSVLHCYQ